MIKNRRSSMYAAAVMAALFAQGRVLHSLALALFLAIFVMTASRAGTVSTTCCATGLVALLAETYFAVRVGLDAALFERLACDVEPDLAALDASLASAGLRGTPKTTRSLAERMTGARYLFAFQGAAVVALALILIATVGLGR
jgi:hypothetical protein